MSHPTGVAGRLAVAFIHSKLTPLVIIASMLLGVYAVVALPREEEPQIEAAPVVGRIDGKLFADIVVRESAIKAAGIAHGLRRALAPEVRNRIRFEMKREVRRARKQRKADHREARREWEARQRAEVDEDSAA